MLNKISLKDMTAIGFMLFALFFGAGNLIFPPALGQAAGTNLWLAMIGFLITGVGLPLLGVLAIGLSGSDDSQSLAARVHPLFATVLMVSIYLTIGPLFAIPRTGAVSYEIGIRPFLTNGGDGSLGLFLHTLVFFGITYWLSLNPSKLVDRIGKILTPLLLLILGVILVQPIMNPLGKIQLPSSEYLNHPLFTGFKEGYLTMDTLASVVFGTIVINAIKDKGITNKKDIAKVCAAVGLIAVGCLGIIYVALAYLGAVSVDTFGKAANGGILLSSVVNYYFGSFGNIILGLAIGFACLTTSVGLVAACSSYFANLYPRFTYKQLVAGFTLFSTVIANMGLNQLISFSIPVLVALYPIVIVLILLVMIEPLFSGKRQVYGCSLFLTSLISIVDGLKAAGIELSGLNHWLSLYIPLYDVSFGWVVPAIIGAFLGYGMNIVTSMKFLASTRT